MVESIVVYARTYPIFRGSLCRRTCVYTSIRFNFTSQILTNFTSYKDNRQDSDLKNARRSSHES